MEALTALLVIVGAIFSVIAKMKDEKKKQDSASRPVPRGVRHEPAKETPSAPMNTPQRKAMAAPAPVQRSFMLEGEDPCHQEMLQKRPSPAMPAPAKIGAEGTDDCHDYMLGQPKHPQSMPEAAQLQESQAAQELLQGVILSEVLRRPAPKAYRRRT